MSQNENSSSANEITIIWLNDLQDGGLRRSKFQPSDFFPKNTLFKFIIGFPFFCFFAKKTSQLTETKQFYELISLDTQITANMPPSQISEKNRFSPKKPKFFSNKKLKFRTFCEFLQFQLHSSANLLYFGNTTVQFHNLGIILFC